MSLPPDGMNNPPHPRVPPQGPPVCAVCGQPAMVHITEVKGGVKKSMWLCPQHAQEKGIMIGGLGKGPGKETPSGFEGMKPFAFSPPDILSSFAEMALGTANEMDSRCSFCGISLNDFKKTGRLGCPQCYKNFGSSLLPVIRRVQNAIHHTGQAPERMKKQLASAHRIEELRTALNKAVAEERYEEAAELRDKIRAIEQGAAE